ncbi:unnamed protein product [Lota lota]
MNTPCQTHCRLLASSGSTVSQVAPIDSVKPKSGNVVDTPHEHQPAGSERFQCKQKEWRQSLRPCGAFCAGKTQRLSSSPEEVGGSDRPTQSSDLTESYGENRAVRERSQPIARHQLTNPWTVEAVVGDTRKTLAEERSRTGAHSPNLRPDRMGPTRTLRSSGSEFLKTPPQMR